MAVIIIIIAIFMIGGFCIGSIPGGIVGLILAFLIISKLNSKK